MKSVLRFTIIAVLIIGAIVAGAQSDPPNSGNVLGGKPAGLGGQPGSNAPAPQGSADPWTKIKLSFSATDLKSSYDESSWGFSASAGVSFGFFSAGGSYAHDESTR